MELLLTMGEWCQARDDDGTQCGLPDGHSGAHKALLAKWIDGKGRARGTQVLWFDEPFTVSTDDS
jgi:hypothetical protein